MRGGGVVSTEATEKDPTLFEVPVAHLAWLHAQIAKIERRAVKLGVEAPRVVEVSRHLRPVFLEHADGTRQKMNEECVMLRLEAGKPVKLDGWSLVAAVDDDESGRIVRTVPGVACPRELREAPLTRCDHCHTPRYRTACFVVGHEDGRFAFVGRTCIQDFLGGKNPAGLLAVAEMTWAISEACGGGEDGGFGGGRGATVADLETFLSLTCAMARTYGFVTRKAAEDRPDLTPTSTRVGAQLWPIGVIKNPVAVDFADELRGTEILDWALATFTGAGDENDYAFNVRQLLTSQIVTSRTKGIAASLYAVHARAINEKSEKAARKPSEHVGTVGERRDFFVTIDGIWEHAGDWGVTFIVRMRTPADEVLVWFASAMPTDNVGEPLPKGWRGYLHGTVKKHETRKGEKQTVITRAHSVNQWVMQKKAKRAKKASDPAPSSVEEGKAES